MEIIDLKTKKCIDIHEMTKNELILILGNFDGVHIGHLELVRQAVKQGREIGKKVAVWTFERHPRNIIAGRNVVVRLTLNDEKNEIFSSEGVDYIIYEDFNSLRSFAPREFAEEILIKKYNCISAFCGFNFRFGVNGSGTSKTLVEVMNENGRSVTVVSPVSRNGVLVCSTQIRKFVENGQMKEAMELLGRPYSINFPVVEGKKLGRSIGLPTINQSFPFNHIKPKNGIYCCTVFIDDDIFLGVSNVGCRPTVNDDRDNINCETHILNYSGNLYGERIKICFYDRLRDEQKFNDLSELKAAIENDIKNTIEYFSKM